MITVPAFTAWAMFGLLAMTALAYALASLVARHPRRVTAADDAACSLAAFVWAVQWALFLWHQR